MSATNIQAPEGMVPVLVQADVPYPYSIQRATYVAGWNACRAAVIAAAPVVVVDEAMIDAALFCTPRGGSMDEDLAMPIDFMGLGQPEKLPLARQVMGAALAAALKVSP